MTETVHYITNRGGRTIYCTALKESGLIFGDRINGKDNVLSMVVFAPSPSDRLVFEASVGEVVGFTLTNPEQQMNVGDTFEISDPVDMPIPARAAAWRAIFGGAK